MARTVAVYLDHAASSPLRPAARAAYLAAAAEVGNPASVHGHGQAARRLLEDAREEIAAAVGCQPIELVFTSGGTESVNLAVKGLYWARLAQGARPEVALTAAEHHATLDTVEWLARTQGAVPRWLAVDAQGVLDAGSARAALGAPTAVATTLLVNNEVGAVQPVRELVAVAAEHGVPVHVDAVAAFGHLPLDFGQLGAAALSISAHKIGGPIGIGALAVARTATLEPLLHGGGQQRGLRSGTQDAPAAAAFAAAVRELRGQQEAEDARLRRLAARLVGGVLGAVPGARLSGPGLDAVLLDAGVAVPARVSGNVHFTFEGVTGETLLFLLDVAGISVSTGSACQAGVTAVSHVLQAMGLPPERASGAIRISLGHSTSEAEVERLLAVLPDAVERARAAG